LEVKDLTEKEIDVPERLQDMSKKLGEFKDAVVTQFKDMEMRLKTGILLLEKRKQNTPLALT
jgi:hypothetical protein